jgi:uncharacterized damage-inducible protein DinB
MKNDDSLRKELLNYLEKPHTHGTFANIVKDFPEKLINEKPAGLPYSFWQMLEHICISQFDMVNFIRNPNYKEMEWPKDYWPDDKEKATIKMWKECSKKYEEDIEALKKIIEDPKTDLFAPIPHGKGQTIFKEALQIIDHASYHLGEFLVMRRLAGAWR